MCNNNTYGLPIALIMEELIQLEKPPHKDSAEQDESGEEEQDK